MEAIYASKLYKASKNKDKIKAALKDPINKELVKQLKSYLDEDYQRPEYVDPDYTEPEKSDKADESEEQIRPSQHSAGGAGGHSFSSAPSGPDHHLSDMVREDEQMGDETAPKVEPNSESSESGKDVAESTKVSGEAVKANTCMEVWSAKEADSIKGLLNSIDDTTGVVRIVVKDNELWIHYNDDTNLNNVMEPVIYQLNAANYSQLQFNRLARTENAIVFSITLVGKPVESLEGTDNE